MERYKFNFSPLSLLEESQESDTDNTTECALKNFENLTKKINELPTPAKNTMVKF